MKSQTTFISYSRIDTDFVIDLVKDLRLAGINIWLDQKDIDIGDRWDNSVQNALLNCERLIFICSPNSVSSENVLDEVYYALGEKRKIIPILYKKCDVPFRLKRLQYIDFTQDYSQGIQKLLTLLAKELKVSIDTTLINISSKKKSKEENKLKTTKKNVAEDINLDIKGNIYIGDKETSKKEYDQKNVIKKAKIKSEGDFNLGDS